MATQSYYAEAPAKIKFGRVLIMIGSILFFIMSTLIIAEFLLSVIPNEFYVVDWSQPTVVFGVIANPFLAVFYVIAGIGGICYVKDRGRLKVFASLAGVIMLVVIVIATVLMFRDLIKSCLMPNANVGGAWLTFLQDFISIQLSGGLFFFGWFITKDYTGD